MPEQITLYTAKVWIARRTLAYLTKLSSGLPLCPQGQFRKRNHHSITDQFINTHFKVEIALKEAGLPYEEYQINLKDKPEWYAPKVNPASKVSVGSL